MAEVAQCIIGPDPALATQGYASEHESDSSVLCPKEEQVLGQVTKHRKKSRRHRDENSKKRKRSTSCSTVSSACSFSSKKHKKKKKKKHRRDDPPSPRVNPIFLWVKQSDTKILEVMCEDYDKRNRIRLTKTAAGWRAIPRSEFLTRQSSCQLVKEDTKEEEDDDEEEEEEEEEMPKSEVKSEESSEEVTTEVDMKAEEEAPKTEGSQQCEASKCCDMDVDLNVDENHNNEYENVAEPEPEECSKEDFEEKGLKDLIDELAEDLHEEGAKEEAQEKPPNDSEVDELEEMCNQRIQEEVLEKKEDVYEFIPSPKSCDNKTEEPEFEEEANSPMNLVMENKAPEKQREKLHESLDIVWRLPEGTTIQQAPARPVDTKPAQRPCSVGKYQEIVIPRPSSAVQEEPLDLGKPKPKRCTEPKVEAEKPRAKEELSIDDKTKSKLLELLTSPDPLTQLKEVLSDPTLMVPDPLLVPRARLPALVANPKKEIPRLLSRKQEKMYPKVEPDLLVVSLDHLQSLLQKNGKDEEMAKIYQHQQEMLQTMKKQDMEANALNQMLWLPYLSQLAACESNPDLLTMLNMVIPPYHYNPYHLQQVPTPTYDINQALHHGHYAWPEMAKAHPSNYFKPQPRPSESRSTHSRKREATPYFMGRDSYPQTKIRASPPEPCPNRFPSSEVDIFIKPSTDFLKTSSKRSHERQASTHKKEEKLPEVPRIRVRDHLIDPNAKQKLLSYEMGNLPTTPLTEENQPHLWHPLFSSGEAKPYTSPWQWTTPVTVGE